MIVMVTDSRIGTDAAGNPATNEPALSGSNWLRGLKLTGVRYVVRVDPRSGSGALPVTGDVVPLPYYVGGKELLRKLPALVLTIWGAVGSANVIVTRLPGAVGTLTVMAAVLRRRPLAVEVVGDPAEASRGQGLAHTLVSLVWVQLTRWSVRRASVVRYVTQRVLQSEFPAARKAQTVAFSSVEVNDWLVSPAGPVSTHPRIVAVGTHEQMYKGHDLLIRVLPDIMDACPQIELVLVGDGKCNPHLRRLSEELGVASRVTFVGKVNSVRRLISIVDSAWVFAMPSRTEGLPRALVEAMARRKACVGTRVGGIVELLNDVQLIPKDSIVDLAERLLLLLHDEALRTELGQRNLDSISPYEPAHLEHLKDRWTNCVVGLQA